MNAAIAKTEIALADEFDESRPHSSTAHESAAPTDVTEEPPLSENTDRKLYRRSMAYFIFGFGCNQHSIITDEP